MTGSEAFVFLAQAASCFAMFGAIWIVQLVHYPAFRYVEPARFSEFANFHSRWISFFVAPVMVLELLSGLWLASGGSLFWIANVIGIFAIWGATFAFSVPCHERLARGLDAAAVERLIRTNWIRTILWTVRAVGLSYVLLSILY